MGRMGGKGGTGDEGTTVSKSGELRDEKINYLGQGIRHFRIYGFGLVVRNACRIRKTILE